jgi:hypothetical protein
MATIPSALTWPTTLERERSLRWSPRFGNEHSPPTLDGSIQVRNINGGGLWEAAFGTEQLRGREQLLAWQAMEVSAQGGLQPIDVPLLLCRQRPRPANLTAIVVTAVGALAARDMAARVDLENSGELAAGMHFADYDAALYGWRLYRIDSVAAVGGQPTQRDITFWPPLRFAIADNHALEFEAPRCVMKLAKSDDMDLELELRKRGSPSASFIEAF